MRVRTALIIAMALGVAWIVSSVFFGNAELLQQELRLPGNTSIGIGWAITGAFVLGLLFAMIVGFSREAGRMLERWRLRKASRKNEEIEEEYSRGLIAVLEGHEEVAQKHFRAVLERDSRHFNTLIKLGEVLRNQDRVGEAIEYHRKAHHLKEDDTRPLYALVEDHEAKGDLDRARLFLGQIIGINKNSVAAWRKLRSFHLKEHNWEKALEDHEKVVALSPSAGGKIASDRRTGLGIRYEIAMAKLRDAKARDAIASLKRLIKEKPDFIPAHHGLGQALAGDGQDAEAVKAWYAGFETTGSPIFLTLLEDYYLQREEPLAAIEALKHCISRSEQNTLSKFYLGKLYFRLEMLDDAFSVLSSLVGRASYAPSLHYLLGRIHERRQNHREATLEYRKVIKDTDLVQLEYVCHTCKATSMDWTDRCEACGDWSSIEVNFREEIPPEELGLAPAPIYTART